MVTFKPRQEAAAVLQQWSSGIGQLMQLVDKTAHLIAKERMVHLTQQQQQQQMA
jgi:hypothetical protein